MRDRFLLVLGLAILSVIAFLFVRSTRDDEMASTIISTETPDDGTPSPVVRREPTSAGDTAMKNMHTTVPTASSSRMEIIVVDKASDRRLDGAQVWLLDPTKISPEFLAQTDSSTDPFDVYRRFGTAFVADQDGVVGFDSVAPRASVAAMHDNLSGMMSLENGRRADRRLQLAAPANVAVRVTDDAGAAAADVPVALRIRQADFTHDVMTVRTDATGVARFGGIDRFTDVAATDRVLEVTVAFPLPRPVAATIDPADLPARAVDLALPPTGRLTVVAKSKAMATRLEGRSIHVVLTEPGPAGDFSGEIITTMKDGRAVVPRVGLGLRFMAFSSLDGQTDRLESERRPGPTVANTNVDLQLIAPRYPMVLVGRAVDSQGKSMGAIEIEAHMRSTGNHGTSADRRMKIATDPEGTFRLSLKNVLDGENPRHQIVLDYGPDDEDRQYAVVTLARSFLGEQTCGDVVFRTMKQQGHPTGGMPFRHPDPARMSSDIATER